MTNNERGGIISKLFLVPAGAAVVLGAFILGYYAGKHQSAAGELVLPVPPLPEVVSHALPKPEEFTFYKTLTDRENRTISIDLKTRSLNTDSVSVHAEGVDAPNGTVLQAPEGQDAAMGNAGKSSARQPERVNAGRKATPAKKEAPSGQAVSSKHRYTLQISSYQEKQTAEGEVKKMKQLGFAAFIVSSEVPGKGTRHRVRLGSFTNKEAAEKLRKAVLAKVGGSAVVLAE